MHGLGWAKEFIVLQTNASLGKVNQGRSLYLGVVEWELVECHTHFFNWNDIEKEATKLASFVLVAAL